jgi:hypothetical protein
LDANGVLSSAPSFAYDIVGATLPTTAPSSSALGTFINPAGQPVVYFSANLGGSTGVVLVSLYSTQISVNGYTYSSCPPGPDISPNFTNGQPGAIKLISLQTGQMCWIFFDRNGKPDRGQYVPVQQEFNDLPTWAAVTNDPALIWFDGTGAFYTAPVTTFGGSDTVMGFATGSSSVQFSVSQSAGTAPIYGLDLLGLRYPTAGTISVTDLSGANVTPFTGGIHISTKTPLPPSFSVTVGNLQPISASDLLRVLGTDVNGTETVWFNQSTVTSALRRRAE